MPRAKEISPLAILGTCAIASTAQASQKVEDCIQLAVGVVNNTTIVILDVIFQVKRLHE